MSADGDRSVGTRRTTGHHPCRNNQRPLQGQGVNDACFLLRIARTRRVYYEIGSHEGHVIVSALAKDWLPVGAGADCIASIMGPRAFAFCAILFHLYRAFLPTGYGGIDQFLVISSFASAIALSALVHAMQPKTEQSELFREEATLIPYQCDGRDLIIRQRKSLRSDRNQTSLGGAHCVATGIARQNVFLFQREP